jgi:hypothetical protein
MRAEITRKDEEADMKKINWDALRHATKMLLIICGGISVGVYLPTVALPVRIWGIVMLAAILFILYYIEVARRSGTSSHQTEKPGVAYPAKPASEGVPEFFLVIDGEKYFRSPAN